MSGSVNGSDWGSRTLEQRLIGLKAIAPDPFVHVTLEGAAGVLGDTNNPLRLNLFSTSVRMLFEHIMGPLAPKEEVVNCSWYEPVPNTNGPVRAQRIQYWLQGGLSDEYVTEEFQLKPQEMRARLVKAFNNLSKHVHGRSDTLIVDIAAQEAEAKATLDAVEELLTTYHESRRALIVPLVDSLDESAVQSMLSETILDVDELATHHTIDDICPMSTTVDSIDHATVHYRVSGDIEVTLQWGSNSDRRKGDGAELGHSFPFVCTFDVPVDDPSNIADAEVSFGVDTSGWYGN
ncbi:pPIWI-associating nuclease domain-containing protein [Ruegeria profundi]|uniref:pPIWI-associating nuclease domain-containing protein n=1 Tax=Ruegeria profundi TaxID=1685378 RepID=UPI001CD557CD|nr:hypothetical protein [Ruegeria profundi]MCA0930162.1 hypothetical protein [Ruegeria profundi]